jgi:dTDP-4-amino-4,6-dideoxygalactose transaminase
VSWRIPLSDVRVSRAQKAAVQDVLESGWLSMGPRVAAFEEAFASAAGAAHAIAVSNGTGALLLALRAVGVRPGDEVVVPSLTFVACANVIRALEATPVFADVCAPERPLVDPQDVIAAITERTRAVVVVHYAGARVDMDGLGPVRERGIAIVEDAAHAAGPTGDDGGWLPLYGDVAAFSFFANKNLALGEGGMITCRDHALATQLRLLRSHGMTTGTWDRHRGHASEYDVVTVGWNFRLTEIQAAMGSAGLDELGEGNAARRRLLSAYAEGLAGSPVRPALAGVERTTGHLAVAVLPGAGQRNAVRQALATAGIQSSFHYPPIHRFAAYRDLGARPLPRTEQAAERLITLPLHPWMTSDDVKEICEVVVGASSG